MKTSRATGEQVCNCKHNGCGFDSHSWEHFFSKRKKAALNFTTLYRKCLEKRVVRGERSVLTLCSLCSWGKNIEREPTKKYINKYLLVAIFKYSLIIFDCIQNRSTKYYNRYSNRTDWGRNGKG